MCEPTVNKIIKTLQEMDANKRDLTVERFMSKLQYHPHEVDVGYSKCNNWNAATSQGKRKSSNSIYGSFSFNGTSVRCHLFAFASHYYREISEHEHIDHKCSNTLCCNPRHLQAIPAKINCQKGSTKRWKNSKTSKST